MKAGPLCVLVRRSQGRKVEVKRWEVVRGLGEAVHGEDKLEDEAEGLEEWMEVAAVLTDRAEEDIDWENMDSEEESDEASEGLRSWGEGICTASASACDARSPASWSSSSSRSSSSRSCSSSCLSTRSISSSSHTTQISPL